MKRSVIIADDEPNAREYLTRLINGNNHLELLGTFQNGLEVLEFCKSMSPDLIFLDIEMPGLNGIETARRIMKNNSNSMIIFTTAYDEYAIKAFELEAIGYLLKPFTNKDFDKAVLRAETLLDSFEKTKFSKRIERLWENFSRSDQVFLSHVDIKEKGLIKRIEINDLLYLESDSEYIRFVTSGSVHLKRLSLRMLQKQLPSYFQRIHRSFILNTNKISKWKSLPDGRFQFIMKNEVKIESSRSYRTEIQDWLQ